MSAPVVKPAASSAESAAPGGFLGRSKTFSGVSPLGIGVAWLWLTVIVLLPLAAITVQSFGDGWSGFWDAVTDPAAAAAGPRPGRSGRPRPELPASGCWPC